MINKHFYFGVHATDDLNDGYMGSGQALWKAYEKYGVENFNKEIIEYFDNSDDMFAKEAEIVTQELVDSPECYNLCLGGNGYQINHMVSEQTRQKISDTKKGYKISPEHKQRIQDSGTMFHKGQVPWNKGRHLTDDEKQNLSRKIKGKKLGKRHPLDEELKHRISESIKKIPKGQRFTDEIRKKISEGVKRSKHTQ